MLMLYTLASCYYESIPFMHIVYLDPIFERYMFTALFCALHNVNLLIGISKHYKLGWFLLNKQFSDIKSHLQNR
jgi:hypothetical protein